jgi:hypothetical protein
MNDSAIINRTLYSSEYAKGRIYKVKRALMATQSPRRIDETADPKGGEGDYE